MGTSEVYHSGVVNSDHFCFSFISIVKIKITITYKNLYPSRYTNYQKYLFNRIKNYKEDNVGWKKISQILNSEELKTPMGKVLNPIMFIVFTKKV